ncbi:MAG: FAD-binding protein, partial [Bacilli bacterium]|nr:FAD-binding protein [Bacilli bacterium]
MDINDIQNLIPQENIYMNEPMNKHTSFKIGGPAECLVKIKTIEQLKSILKYSKEKCIDLTIIGNGSNILVSDDGIKGIVAKIEIDNLKIDKQDEKILITVGSGIKLGLLAQKCLKEEIAGFE